jgi:hypothetical protein
MPRRKLHYKEGDWFAVPLDGGGYALGLIARMGRSCVALFGYFFGPRYCDVPTLADAAPLRPADAIHRLRFSDLRLLKGDWPVLGSLPGWDRQQWPVPSFAHRDLVSGRPCIRTFDENSMTFLTERAAREEEIVGLPDDANAGALAVVKKLSRRIREQEQAQASSPGS